MEPKLKSSFIPKQPITPTSVSIKQKRRGEPMSLVFMLTLVVAVVALLVSGAVFFYQQYLETNIVNKANELEQVRAVFEPALIQELRRLDLRMKTAESLVNKHVASSLFLEFLESTTLKNVQYDLLEYSALGDERIDILLQGQAQSFNTLALQSDLFGASEAIDDLLFSDINIDERGSVLFKITASVDSSLVGYSEYVRNKLQPLPSTESSSSSTPETGDTGTTTGVGSEN